MQFKRTKKDEPVDEPVEETTVEPTTDEVVGEGAEAPEDEAEEEEIKPDVPTAAPAKPATKSYLGEPLNRKKGATIEGSDLSVPESDADQGFVRPYRNAVRHIPTGITATLGDWVAQELARDPESLKTLDFPAISPDPIPASEFVFVADNTRVGS